jgi:transcriptional regulator with XRE-family HTH domain
LTITPEQSRAARGWLGWSQQDLAERAGIAKNTVYGFERGQRTLTSNNLAALDISLKYLFSEDKVQECDSIAPYRAYRTF